jgi:hypothetical protein
MNVDLLPLVVAMIMHESLLYCMIMPFVPRVMYGACIRLVLMDEEAPFVAMLWFFY